MSRSPNLEEERQEKLRAKRRAYLKEYNSRPDAKRKSKERNDRYRAKPGVRARDSKACLAKREGDPERKLAKRAYNREWMKQKYQKKRLDKYYEHFMERLLSGDTELLS